MTTISAPMAHPGMRWSCASVRCPCRARHYTVFGRPGGPSIAVLSEPFGGVYEMRFEPVVLGTRVRIEWTVEATTRPGELMLPMVAPLLARALRADLVTIARRACKESLCGP